MYEQLLQDIYDAAESGDLLTVREKSKKLLNYSADHSEYADLAVETISAIRAALDNPNFPSDFPKQLVCNEKFKELILDINSIRSFVFGLSKGELSHPLKLKGFLGGALKTLQANLNHLSWQTKMIAKGDFTQRVDFMGEFADSFNDMVHQLESARKELSDSQERYRNLATIDPLTGLYNRRYFFEVALKEFSRSERASRSISLILLDIDFFKKINDTYGHAAGDHVLKEISTRLLNSLRVSDTACRFGGEEFIALLPETNAESAEKIADRIRVNISKEPIVHSNIPISTTASFGVSEFQGTGSGEIIAEANVDTIINNADLALYRAKETGRNKVVART